MSKGSSEFRNNIELWFFVFIMFFEFWVYVGEDTWFCFWISGLNYKVFGGRFEFVLDLFYVIGLN